MSYHGIALNIDPDLRDFDLIDPCGMPGLVSTSIAEELGRTGGAAVDRGGRACRRAIFAGAFAAGSARRSACDAPKARRIADARGAGMSAGLFELRKDPITGWWVATIVDRDFDRDRFARAAAPDRRRRRLPELPAARRATASGSASSRTTRSTSSARTSRRDELDRQRSPRSSLSDARAAGSWRTIAAPPGEHRALAQVGDVASGC